MRKLIATLTLLLALPALMSAGGRLDKFGGQLNHKTGVYHFYQIDGKKLAVPLEGENPNTNGGKIVYHGTPDFAVGKAVKAEAKGKAAALDLKPAPEAGDKAVAGIDDKKPKAKESKAERKAAKAAKKAAKKASKKEKKEKKGKKAPKTATTPTAS